MVLNEYDVDDAVEVLGRGLGRDHHATRHARFLQGYVTAVNAKSDGWAYWTKGRSPANAMCRLVDQARDALIRGTEPPSEQEFRRAVTPMRTAGTKLGFDVPALGDGADGEDTPGPRF